jgi:hypothetical protein
MIRIPAALRVGFGVPVAACLAWQLAAGAGVVAQAVPGEPRLEILSPADASFVSGSTPMRAAVDPAAAATSVVFFADGRQICTVARPPFDCAWDAGTSIV